MTHWRRRRRTLFLPAVVSGILCCYLALLFLVLRPLHEGGAQQPFLSYLCGLGDLLESPGRFFVAGPARRTAHPPAGRWLLVLLANAGFYFAATAFVSGAGFRRPAAHPTPEPPPDSPRPPGFLLSRRAFLRRGATAGAGGLGAFALGYTFIFEPRSVAVTTLSFPLRGLPPGLDGLRVVQLTDIHLGPWLSLEFVRSVVRTASSLAPDLIVLTGDYIHQSGAYIAPVASALGELRARIGAVAVLGNHDWWEDGPHMRRELERAGIPLVDNSRLFVTPERKLAREAREGLCVAGIGDLWEDEVDFRRALAGVPDAMPRLLLSHNPDAAEEPGLAREGHRVDLMLSGHTHGGQVRLPGLGAPMVPSRFGQKYARGLVQGPACPVFVSRGIGMTVLPVRFGASPEIAVIELKAV